MSLAAQFGMEVISSLFSSPSYQATKAMLDATAARHEAIASNLANTNTPGYKRIDLDATFETELRNSIRNNSLKPNNLPSPVLSQDRTEHYSRADGNNVQIDRELAALSSNATNYTALTQFVSGSLRQLRMAITGRPS